MTRSNFHQLIQEAEDAPFSGWDFSFFEGRMHTGDLPWDYRARVIECLPGATALLDMGTGGGELLSSLRPLPPTTYATEAYPPNLPVARAQLAPLGVNIVAVVYLLRAIPWQLPGFSVATYEPRLRELHDQIQNHGPLVARDHRYYLEVEKA